MGTISIRTLFSARLGDIWPMAFLTLLLQQVLGTTLFVFGIHDDSSSSLSSIIDMNPQDVVESLVYSLNGFLAFCVDFAVNIWRMSLMAAP